jgi:DNA end-binding protein Ku
LPHAIWNGSISLGLVNIPVSIYLAARDRLVNFHNLHSTCKSPLQNKRWCPYHNVEVPWNEVVKGYEISKGKYVVIEKKELQAIQLKSTRAIDVIKFIDAGQIDPLLVENNYYLVPQIGGEKAYTLFRDVLSLTSKAAIGKVVIRSKERLVAIRQYRKGMILTVLHYNDEIVPMEEMEALKRLVVVKDSELKLARILIDKLSGSFDIEDYKDEYEGALVKMIKRKIAGEKIEKAADIKPTPTKDLMKALKVSVETARKRK